MIKTIFIKTSLCPIKHFVRMTNIDLSDCLGDYHRKFLFAMLLNVPNLGTGRRKTVGTNMVSDGD